MNQRFLVIGSGVTGQSFMTYLSERNLAFDIYDTRSQVPNRQQLKAQYPEANFYCGEPIAVDFSKYQFACVSPGIPPYSNIIKACIDAGIEIQGDLELFAQARITKPVIAITGTNGKSTVTSLVGHILETAGLDVAIAGNIGQAMLSTIGGEYDAWVLELSSFQLTYQSSFKPHCATILNLSEDHLDWHQSFEEYCLAKHKIYQSEIQVFELGVEQTLPLKMTTAITYSTTGNAQANYFYKEGKFFKGHQLLFDKNNLSLAGLHNYKNILAALALVDDFSIEPSILSKALSTFNNLHHRCELVRYFNHSSWVNDSKGTNVGAAMAAINGLGNDITGKIIWIAGGLGKGANFSPLEKPLKDHVKLGILLGQDKHKLAEVFSSDIPVIFVENMKQAVEKANQFVQHDDCVLLSPACASMDMYKNYMERGEVFSKHVMEL